MRLLGDVPVEGAARHGARVALIFREQTMTYAELAQRVTLLAQGLESLEIRPGDRIALLLPNCPPFVLGYYAAATLGAVVVPANPLLKPAELEYIWGDARIRLVITVPPLLPTVLAARATLPELQYLVSCGDREETPETHPAANIPGFLTLAELMTAGSAGSARESPDPPLQENDCAVIIYTSGTTGRPKGAMLSHKNLIRNVEQLLGALEFYPDDCFFTALPLFHSFAGTVCMNTVLYIGCASVLTE